MRSILLAVTLLLIYVSALPGTPNYVAPSNSTRVLRQTSDSGKNLEDILGQRKEDSEDVGPLGEVQLDVEEEDIGEAAEQKMRVRRGYSGGSQQKSKYGGGGQSNKYGGSGGGNKYDGGQQKQQNQGGYGQQPASGGKYGGGQSQGGSGYY
uniref:DUF148 domain-containing protein n=1 Tax=Caenorhabditis tropicalis TaxID=1561998 RepID=A0A1I7TFV4_9PELO